VPQDKFDREKYQYLQKLTDLAKSIQVKVTNPEYRESNSYQKDIEELTEHFADTFVRLMGNKVREASFDITKRVDCAFKNALKNLPLE
jgi:hypothetical protein